MRVAQQHFGVMVAFQQHEGTAGHMLLHDFGEVTKVGGGGDAGIAVIQPEADGLRRVMGVRNGATPMSPR